LKYYKLDLSASTNLLLASSNCDLSPSSSEINMTIEDERQIERQNETDSNTVVPVLAKELQDINESVEVLAHLNQNSQGNLNSTDQLDAESQAVNHSIVDDLEWRTHIPTTSLLDANMHKKKHTPIQIFHEEPFGAQQMDHDKESEISFDSISTSGNFAFLFK
jgi:TolA-binding protein